ncbi:MAG: hypothetical protein KF856_13425 [Cyclobacteriaceae bacterium]|nr:hypothetical protein [Cyclobacteriaceae bacterium]
MPIKNTIQTADFRQVLSIILGLFLTCPAFAQVDSIAKFKADSLKEQLELKRKKVDAFSDSLSRKATKVTDSVNQIRAKAMALIQVKDTLKLANRLDSLRGRMESIPDADRLLLFDPDIKQIDSLKLVMHKQAQAVSARVDKTETQIKNSIDSLQQKYVQQSEMILQRWGLKNPGLDKLQGDLSGKMGWDMPPVALTYPEFSPDLKLNQLWPDLNLGDLKLKDLSTLDTSLPALNLPGMPSLPSIPGMESIKKFNTSFKQVNDTGKQLKAYRTQLDSLKGLDTLNYEQLGKLAEQQLTRLDEIKTIQEHHLKMEKIKQMQTEYLAKMQAYQDPEKLKQETLSKATDVATDHLLKQKTQVSDAQAKLGKIKRKYGQVQSINDLPKRPPNPMKEKPFRERIFPGVALQVIQKDNYSSLYFAPHVYYRLNGRFDFGGGGIVHFNFDKKPQFIHNRDVWGYKTFVNYRFYKAFYLRLEGERLNQQLPLFATDETYKQWSTIFLGGIGKEFKISRLFNGHTWMFYNMKGQDFNPYSSRIVLRVGFDISLKKDQRRQYIKALFKK